jgi:hypothetical protein
MSKYTLKCTCGSWSPVRRTAATASSACRSANGASWGGATDMSIYEASVPAERRQKVQAAQAAKTMLVKAFANRRPRAAAKAA